MPTTRAAARALVVEELGGGRLSALTTTSAGAAGGTTTVNTALIGWGDDYFNGYWLVLTLGPSGAGSYTAVRVTDFTSATGTLTHAAVGAPTQVASGATFELHKYDPVIIHLALNEAMKVGFEDGVLFLPVLDETLVTDNLLLNSDFETFAASNFTNWTLGGAGASVAESTTILWHGADAAAVTAGAGAAAT